MLSRLRGPNERMDILLRRKTPVVRVKLVIAARVLHLS